MAVETPSQSVTAVYRVEVRAADGQSDSAGQAVLEEARRVFGFTVDVRTARVYLIEAPLDNLELARLARELLADPITQQAITGHADTADVGAVCEVHYKPGVMDPVAQSTRDAIVEMLPHLTPQDVRVRTGVRYDITGTTAPPGAVIQFAQMALANPVIQEIHLKAYHPDSFPTASDYAVDVVHVNIRKLDDQALAKLSRQRHLFLSNQEMRAVRDYFCAIGREPTDIELETLAQTWSEHCVHKTLKSRIHYRESADASLSPSAKDFADRPGHELQPDGTLVIDNLLQRTVVAATYEMIAREEGDLGEWCVSVFADNAGIVRFDDDDGVCIKVETHNHPSAIEPYGGAATGIGGCIRDVMGTGLSARPVANTAVFCVAPARDSIPKGVIAPERILQQVVAGVRDYGNRMGIPTVNGAVYFHESYLGNPLVYCGCIGLIPLDKCFGEPSSGDRIIVLGGRTGRDGIHGATFSSAELTDSHADEFGHAVQIGNAITQKKTMDVILAARDADDGPWFSAITDCGAGGFSSAVGEMGEHVGASVTLESAPLKYAGLTYSEIWISEAQERMVLAVPQQHVDSLRALCDAEDVEFCDLGQFGQTSDAGEAELVLMYAGTEVGRLSMSLLHDGLPTLVRVASAGRCPSVESRKVEKSESQKSPSGANEATTKRLSTFDSILKALLSHPNIASKHWIIRQYDHEVQGGSVVKPLVGPMQDGPSDAAVVRPKLTSPRGVALGCGLAPALADPALADDADAYWMAAGAIDEAVRNLVCVGADPKRIAILDNFCWPSCDDPRQLGSLVRAAEGCYDAAIAYATPFVSGKDSLNNQFTTEDGDVIAIVPTLLITGLGIVANVEHTCTMDAKSPGNLLLIIGGTTNTMGGSHFVQVCGATVDADAGAINRHIARVDLQSGPRHASYVAQLVAQGLIVSAHDCSDGGLIVAAAEMAFAGRVGLDIDLAGLPVIDSAPPRNDHTRCFAETPSRYLLEVVPSQLDQVMRCLRDANVSFGQVGRFAEHDRLVVRTPHAGQLLDASLDELREAWLGPLDW